MVFMSFMHSTMTIFHTILSLVKRLPPHAVVGNQDLLNALILKSSAATKLQMSSAQTAVHFASAGALSITVDGVIDWVNHALTTLLGHSPEELLGQTAGVIFTPESLEQFEPRLEQKEAFSDEFMLRSERGNDILCQVSLVILEGSVNRRILVVEDISTLAEEREKAIAAKDATGRLLCAILPKPIVERLEAGESDISFSVPIITVMFLGIVQFDEYAAGFTPQQLLDTISTIFGLFDESLPLFPLVTKIRTVGGQYICVSDLFGENPGAGATELVNFGLKCLEEIDDMNTKMNSELDINVGLVSGGPVVAGVLGLDAKKFDVMGQPLRLAAQLLASAPAGSLQLSASTYAYISGSGIEATARENVKLYDHDVVTYIVKLQ
jgi:PAS domain S-box-containing protein